MLSVSAVAPAVGDATAGSADELVVGEEDDGGVVEVNFIG